MAQKKLQLSFHCPKWIPLTNTHKTLLRDELFQSLHATKTTQSLKLGLAFVSS